MMRPRRGGGGHPREGGGGGGRRIPRQRGRKERRLRLWIAVQAVAVGLLPLLVAGIQRVSPGLRRHPTSDGDGDGSVWFGAVVVGSRRRRSPSLSLGLMSRSIHMFGVREEGAAFRSHFGFLSRGSGARTFAPMGAWLDRFSNRSVAASPAAAFVPIESRRHRGGRTGGAFFHDPLNEESTSRGM